MSSLIISGDTSGTVIIAAPAVAGSGTLTLPTGTDTLVGLAATQTLTNKTLTTPNLGTPSTLVLTNATGLAAAAMPAGSVLQVVSVTKTDTFSSTSASYVDVTGLSVAITPRSASNKILVLGTINFAASADVGFIRLVRDAQALQIGDAAGSRVQASSQMRNNPDSADADSGSVNFLDSPNTTSSTTYKIQVVSPSGGYTTRINASADDVNQTNRGRTASTITVMEIAV